DSGIDVSGSTETQLETWNLKPETFETAALPPLAVDRRADNPVARLQAFLREFDGRVLVLAESLGRRETMLDYCGLHGIKPVPCANFAEFLAGNTGVMLGVAPLVAGFALPGRKL